MKIKEITNKILITWLYLINKSEEHIVEEMEEHCVGVVSANDALGDCTEIYKSEYLHLNLLIFHFLSQN